MQGHTEIKAKVFGADDKLIGTGDLPIENLLSPKSGIRIKTAADIRRWNRIWQDAASDPLPFPEIEVDVTSRSGALIADVEFET